MSPFKQNRNLSKARDTRRVDPSEAKRSSVSVQFVLVQRVHLKKTIFQMAKIVNMKKRDRAL